jgi:hypothetical protein
MSRNHRRRVRPPPSGDPRMGASGNPTRGIGRRPHAAWSPRSDHGAIGSVTEEAEMVGIMFLYGIWAVLAFGAIVASAMAFREHE